MGKIGVIDSGIGGISTLSKILKLLPNEDYIYVSDRSNLPYGNKSSGFIYRRVEKICKDLMKCDAKAVVIACNTATAAVIEKLRRKLKVILVGVEPAIKPALSELAWGKALVLLTPSAFKQIKIKELLNRFENKKLIISPQKYLASLIENNINNLDNINDDLEKMLNPLKSKEIESVVLGCTHYCLVKEKISKIFNAKVYDGNIGTAKRLYDLLKQNHQLSTKNSGSIEFIRL